MKYKLLQRENPASRSAGTITYQWHATGVNEGRIHLEQICARMADRSTLTRTDIKGVICSFIDVLPEYLLMGKSINLEEFGTLRLSLTSEGVEDKEDFHHSLVKTPKIVFLPSVKFKDKVSKPELEQVES